MKTKTLFLLFVFIFIGFTSLAQSKKPFLFRLQEKKVSQKVHKYLRFDTIIRTSKASIHVNYSKDETKPYLLLLQGMAVDGKTNWYKQIGPLSKHFNLILPDLIYFGSSTSEEKNYSVEFQVEQLHELIGLLSINTKINVMGFSYGGLTAAVFNQLYPQQIKRLIIVDGPVKYFSTQTADSLAKVSGAPTMTNIILPQSLDDFSAMEKALFSRKIPFTKKYKRKVIAYYFSPTKDIRKLQLQYLSNNQEKYQSYNYNLDKTQSLLVWGAKDGVVPVSVGLKLHQNFKTTSELVIYKKAKHDVPFRYSKKFNKKVIQFLNN